MIREQTEGLGVERRVGWLLTIQAPRDQTLRGSVLSISGSNRFPTEGGSHRGGWLILVAPSTSSLNRQRFTLPAEQDDASTNPVPGSREI